MAAGKASLTEQLEAELAEAQALLEQEVTAWLGHQAAAEGLAEQVRRLEAALAALRGAPAPAPAPVPVPEPAAPPPPHPPPRPSGPACPACGSQSLQRVVKEIQGRPVPMTTCGNCRNEMLG